VNSIGLRPAADGRSAGPRESARVAQLYPLLPRHCFRDNEEFGPAALAKIAKETGLRPGDL
jgi:hypothetical protein